MNPHGRHRQATPPGIAGGLAVAALLFAATSVQPQAPAAYREANRGFITTN